MGDSDSETYRAAALQRKSRTENTTFFPGGETCQEQPPQLTRFSPAQMASP
jgi:hypothetical protein